MKRDSFLFVSNAEQFQFKLSFLRILNALKYYSSNTRCHNDKYDDNILKFSGRNVFENKILYKIL